MFAGLINLIADGLSRRVFATSLEDPRFNLNDPAAWEAFGAGSSSDAGIRVNASKALTLAPVWQAVSIISGDVAAATPHVYKRDSEGDRTIDDKHPADYLIAEQPNVEMSAFEFWRRFMLHLLLWQNGYAYIERDGGVGRPIGLYNLLPDRTCPKRDKKGTLYYVTEVDGSLEPLAASQVIHVKGLSIDNGIGLDLVCKARDSWGLSLAAEGYGSKFFANGAQAGGIVEVPLGTSEPAADNIANSIQKKHSGKNNWFKVMVLRDGAKFHSTTIDAQKSQLTELREHQVRDTSRFFNLPPGKLGLEDSVSYNSAEQSQIQYTTGCLTHWFGAVRGEAQLKLLSEQERRKRSHFIDFNVSKLIERDLKTQVEILAIERQNEIINAAEWRRKRDLPPRDDAAAQEYVNPNTKSAEKSGADSGGEDESEQRTDTAMRALLREVANRMGRRAGQAARKASKSGAEFQEFVEAKAASQHRGFEESMMPVAGVIAANRGTEAVELYAVLHWQFFGALQNELAPVLSLSANELESNAQAACLRFESQIADTLVRAVFGEPQEQSHAA